jgi:hypothetical protein
MTHARTALPNARIWNEADGAHIDVRGLPPPEPMTAIIGLIRTLRAPTPVIVHHERDPLLLYAELAEIGWSAERVDAEPGEFRLRLTPSP